MYIYIDVCIVLLAKFMTVNELVYHLRIVNYCYSHRFRELCLKFIARDDIIYTSLANVAVIINQWLDDTVISDDGAYYRWHFFEKCHIECHIFQHFGKYLCKAYKYSSHILLGPLFLLTLLQYWSKFFLCFSYIVPIFEPPKIPIFLHFDTRKWLGGMGLDGGVEGD